MSAGTRPSMERAISSAAGVWRALGLSWLCSWRPICLRRACPRLRRSSGVAHCMRGTIYPPPYECQARRKRLAVQIVSQVSMARATRISTGLAPLAIKKLIPQKLNLCGICGYRNLSAEFNRICDSVKAFKRTSAGHLKSSITKQPSDQRLINIETLQLLEQDLKRLDVQ